MEVSGSGPQYNGLLNGTYDIINSATDNVAFRVGNLQLPISIIAGADKGVLFVFAVNSNPAGANIQSYDDLRALLSAGTKPNILVDSPASGFSYALRKILFDNGFYWNNATDNNYNMINAGGSGARFNALRNGVVTVGGITYIVHGTMLGSVSVASFTSNQKILTVFKDVMAPYQNNIVATSFSVAESRAASLVAFLRGYIRGAQHSSDAANREEMIGYLTEFTNGNPIFGRILYDGYIDSVSGTNRNARLDRQGLKAVVTLRNDFNGFTTPFTSEQEINRFINPAPRGFYDNRFFNEALSSIDLE